MAIHSIQTQDFCEIELEFQISELTYHLKGLAQAITEVDYHTDKAQEHLNLINDLYIKKGQVNYV